MKRIIPSQEETQLMERCVERANMLAAWKRVKGNGGSPGVDGKTIEETGKHLKKSWPVIRQKLLEGSYVPSPVRRVEIAKPGGGTRKLGIPSVTDRLIQQCILQVLQPNWDPTFHKHSYGFRPGRSQWQAVKQAQIFVQEGRRWCVDVDLEKFFDRVNHDILMDRVNKRIKDERLTTLIRRYLKAGVMDQGVFSDSEEGTPQGGPLSPLLSNLLLDEVDHELERRGLAFVRYADDCNIYVRSKRAAERAFATIEKIVGKLKLKINKAKSAVALATKRKFLGFRFWNAPGRIVKVAVAPQALARFKDRVRSLTRRSCGKSLEQVIDALDGYLCGWKNYFRLANTPGVFGDLDAWIRRRLRMIQLKQWKRGTTCFRELKARGLSQKLAASVAAKWGSPWHAAGMQGMNMAFPNSYFDGLDLERLRV
jgi:RNA-directed DNA polymerase